jgi:cellulose synthase/poly-beta-1,6-N-acetylglucosamine synthase-like glycosyltransferase
MTGNVLFLVALGSIWVMLLYHMFLMLGGYLYSERMERRKAEPRRRRPDEEWPFVSVLIPAHNEEIVIRYTLDAMLRLDYPHDKIEIIVIDDNSGDATGEIVDEYCARDARVRCLHLKPPQAAKGKSNALNQALMIARGELIVVYDADNTPNSGAVKHLVEAALEDPKAGAVVGKFRVINARKNLLTRFINIETISFQWMAQAGRWFWFGISTIPGTNFLIRRSIIEEMGGWDIKALTEDTELSIRLYDNGYHIRFHPLAVTWEQEPETWRVWLKQRTRWARGNQYVIMKNLPRIFGKWNGRIVFDLVYFFFTYFVFLGAVMLSHLLMILNLLGAVSITLPGPFLLIWLLAYVLYVVEIMVTLAIEKTELTFKNFLILLLMYVTYSQLWLFLIFRSAWIQLRAWIRHDEVKWDKTQRFQTTTKTARDFTK